MTLAIQIAIFMVLQVLVFLAGACVGYYDADEDGLPSLIFAFIGAMLIFGTASFGLML